MLIFVAHIALRIYLANGSLIQPRESSSEPQPCKSFNTQRERLSTPWPVVFLSVVDLARPQLGWNHPIITRIVCIVLNYCYYHLPFLYVSIMTTKPDLLLLHIITIVIVFVSATAMIPLLLSHCDCWWFSYSDYSSWSLSEVHTRPTFSTAQIPHVKTFEKQQPTGKMKNGNSYGSPCYWQNQVSVSSENGRKPPSWTMTLRKFDAVSPETNSSKGKESSTENNRQCGINRF